MARKVSAIGMVACGFLAGLASGIVSHGLRTAKCPYADGGDWWTGEGLSPAERKIALCGLQYLRPAVRQLLRGGRADLPAAGRLLRKFDPFSQGFNVLPPDCQTSMRELSRGLTKRVLPGANETPKIEALRALHWADGAEAFRLFRRLLIENRNEQGERLLGLGYVAKSLTKSDRPAPLDNDLLDAIKRAARE